LGTENRELVRTPPPQEGGSTRDVGGGYSRGGETGGRKGGSEWETLIVLGLNRRGEAKRGETNGPKRGKGAEEGERLLEKGWGEPIIS